MLKINMSSSQLEQVRREISEYARQSGAMEDVFDVARYRAALGESKYPLPDGTVISGAQYGARRGYWVLASNADHRRRLLYLHGGGLVVGGIHSHKGIAAWLSHYASCAVFFPEYSLAPEHPYPAALQDCRDALDHIWNNGPGGLREAETLVVAGDSAGAGLCAALMMGENDPKNVVRAICLICPMLDWNWNRSSALLGSVFRTAMAKSYSGASDVNLPTVSPICGDWSRMPPLMIQHSTADVFSSDAIRATELARACGGQITLETWHDVPHVWHRFAPYLPEATEALKNAGEFLRNC